LRLPWRIVLRGRGPNTFQINAMAVSPFHWQAGDTRTRAARSSCGSPEPILPPRRHPPATGTSLFVKAFTKINKRQMMANWWTVKFDRIALTPRMISCDRCGTVAPIRGWMEGRH
jgi:hypothetical protein